MHILILLLLIVGALCFAAAAFGVQVRRTNLVALGLLAWLLTVLIPALVS